MAAGAQDCAFFLIVAARCLGTYRCCCLGRPFENEQPSEIVSRFRAIPCLNADGSFLTPSVVTSILRGMLVGAAAKDFQVLHPERAAATFKRHIGEPIHQAVITVPAYFNDPQRQATAVPEKLSPFLAKIC